MKERDGPGQDGAATVVMAALSLLLVSCLGVLALLWQAYAAKRYACNVAEFSALAAADAARGIVEAQPCPLARELARKHGMEVENCELTGDLLDIVRIDVSYRPGGWITVRSSAKAGSPRYRK